jgi:hypothetical protein
VTIHKTKHLWHKRIKQEFGVPVRTLVQSFIDTRYSRNLTAGAMGIAHTTLIRYCKVHNIKFPKRKDLREECKPKPRALGQINNPYGRKGKPK